MTTGYSDEDVRRAAKARVARLFNVDPDTLGLDVVFGEGLEASFVSDWKYNEFDQLLHDVRDVADRQTLKALETGDLVIRTVGAYCEYMVRSYRADPADVTYLLFK
jgi:hypothetical protein